MKSAIGSAVMLFLWTSALTVVCDLLQHQDAALAPTAAEVAPLSFIHPDHLDAVILGQKQLYDDFLQLWLLQRLGDPPSADGGERLLGAIRSVIRHQPKIESLYLVSCIGLFNDYHHPEHCQEIVLAGLKVMPQSWKLPMMQGYVHNFLLDQPGLAAAFFDHAAALPSSPPYVKSLAKRLAAKEGMSLEEARKNLELLLWDNAGSGLQRFIKR